jgi:hypothetical protein
MTTEKHKTGKIKRRPRRYAPNLKHSTVYPDGSEVLMTAGPFMSLAQINQCLVPGRGRRTVRITGESELFGTTPAMYRVGRRWIRGLVETYTLDGLSTSPPQGWRFVPHHENVR